MIDDFSDGPFPLHRYPSLSCGTCSREMSYGLRIVRYGATSTAVSFHRQIRPPRGNHHHFLAPQTALTTDELSAMSRLEIRPFARVMACRAVAEGARKPARLQTREHVKECGISTERGRFDASFARESPLLQIANHTAIDPNDRALEVVGGEGGTFWKQWSRGLLVAKHRTVVRPDGPTGPRRARDDASSTRMNTRACSCSEISIVAPYVPAR